MHESLGDTRPLLREEIHVGRIRSAKRRNCLMISIVSILLAAFIALFAIYYVKYRQLSNATKPAPDWQRMPKSHQNLVTFSLNAVSADASSCSTIGSFVLNALGGNAMDAAVAAMLCIGVCNPQSNGIGGGSFMIFYDRTSTTAHAFNYREKAAAATSRDMFNNLALNASEKGGLAIAVPGEVKGLFTAHSKFGKLQWREVVAPVVQLLRAGHRVTPPLASAMSSEFEKIPAEPPFLTLKNWMINPETQEIYKAGDVLKDELLAATMETIAEAPLSYYNGNLSAEIVSEIKNAAGLVTEEDLKNYSVDQPEPLNVSLPFAQLQLLSIPPPCSGAVLSFIMQLIDGFKPTPSVKNSLTDYVNFLHRIVESTKFGYAKRSALGDPKFVNVTELLANLTSAAYADSIRAKITDDRTHDVKYYGPSFEWNHDSGTTHLSVVDDDGNAVAVTSTINTYFGSWIRGPKTGIIFNNQMDDFSVPNRTNSFGLPASPSNFISPGKRPMSSTSPSILTDSEGNVKFVSGGSGGTRITTSVAYAYSRMIYLNETVKQATDAYRLHHQLLPDEISYNPEFDVIPEEIYNGLAAKGHKLRETSAKSTVEAIVRVDSAEADGWQVSGDPRKPSVPGGN